MSLPRKDLKDVAPELESEEAPMNPSRARCPVCRQSRVNCYCDALVPQQTPSKFIFLQHPAEARNPVGTALMAHLSLSDSHLFVGVDFSRDEGLQELLQEANGSVGVLFPSNEAVALESLSPSQLPKALIVIDGTWSQAEKIWKTNAFLQRLPAYRFLPREPSRYRIRAEPEAHCVSTIEAVATALRAMDGQDHESMLQPFLQMVARQVAHSESDHRSPRHCAIRNKQPFIPRQVRKFPSDLLLVHAICFGKHERKNRVVALAAKRLSTQETFVATEANPGDPNSSNHLAQAWKKFARGEDVWVTWSNLSLALAQSCGVEVPEGEATHVKHWCATCLKKSPGTLRDAAAIFGDASGTDSTQVVEAMATHTTPEEDAQTQALEALNRLERVFQHLRHRVQPSHEKPTFEETTSDSAPVG